MGRLWHPNVLDHERVREVVTWSQTRRPPEHHHQGQRTQVRQPL